MAVAGGPNLSENGLVFYYDTDNGKSYKGEPATNSQDPDYAAFTQAGFDAWGCYDGSNSHLWDVNQSKTFLNILGPDGYPTDVMLYHNFTGGFHGPTHWGGVPAALLTAGSKITVQGWVKAADAASVGKSVAPHLYYNKIGGGSYSSSTSYALTEEWQLVSHSYTVPEGSTGTGTMYFFTQNPSEVKMYITKTAIVGGKLHAVQWLPGATTRSATESLYDFISDSALDVSNVSFDSNADITFDGSNDYVSLGDNSAWDFGQNGTLEMIVRPTNSTTNDRLWCIDNNSSNLDAYLNGSSYNVYMHGGVVGTTTPLTQNQYNHLAVVYNGGTIQIYVNGTAGTMTGTTTGYNITNPSANNNNLYLGCYRDLGYNLYGDINLFKIYNRALTAEEVQNNFNGIRSRFGI